VYRRWKAPSEEQSREHRWALGVLERGIMGRASAGVLRMFVMTCEPLPAWGTW
jgi:hypothetical protein